MPFIWLALVLSWAIMRAAEETWGYGKVATAPVRSKLDNTVRARSRRGDWIPSKAATRKAKRRGSWWSWAGVTVIWLTGKTLHYGWGAAKATGRGIRTGVGEGHRRFREGKEARQPDWDWDDWFRHMNEKSYEPEPATAERVDEPATPQPEPEIFDAEVVEDEPATKPSTAEGDHIERVAIEAARQGETMTEVTGEAVNLEQARIVAVQINGVLGNAVNTVEQMMASLGQAGVGDVTIARFGAVMDALCNAHALAVAAQDGMENDHSNVEEAVLANAGAVAKSTDFYRS